MEWLDSLCAWVMSVIASFLALFGFSSVETLCVPTPLSHGADAASQASEGVSQTSKVSEVLEAFASTHVAPILVDLSEADVGEPPNM